MSTANRVFDAPIQQNGPVPAYKIVEVPGPHKRTISRFDEKTKTLIREDVMTDVGYMVFFPKGHSHMYHSLEALEAAGFGEVVPLINLANESEINAASENLVRVPIQKGEK